MSRTRRLFLRLTLAALTLAAICFVSIWSYVGYEARRAESMLSELSRVQIGDAEGSIIALTTRYGGFKGTPEPLSPREQWIDKEEYDYQITRQCDHLYELGVSPFGTTLGRVGTLVRTMHDARELVPHGLRPLLGLRDWGTVADVCIRSGNVQSVSAMTLFEGRSEWLGHRWELAQAMPRHDMTTRSYAVGAANLTMADGGGMMIENYFTSGALREQVEAAHKLNLACLTSVKGCDGFCDAAPRPLAYLRQHSDAAWNIVPPRCD